MSTAIPPNPNTIIANLLEVAQAAYVLAHSPSQDLLDNLKTQLNLLEDLPQYCSNPVNGPCRARYHLQSFLEADNIASLIEKRTRSFPIMTMRMDLTPEQEAEIKRVFEQYSSKPLQAGEFVEGLNMKTIPISMLVGAADVQRDAIEFEFQPQEWKAPAETPPDRERRLRERMIEPATPVVGKTALVEATRPLFVKAMQAEGHRADLDERGLYKGVSEHRWEGWRAAVESMGFKPTRDEVRDQLLADTADEALRIINDAGLLKNLVEIFTMRDPGTSVRIFERPSGPMPWRMHVEPPENGAACSYESTSLHQLIAVAHKGEQDHEYPESPLCEDEGCPQSHMPHVCVNDVSPKPPAPPEFNAEIAWTADAVRVARAALEKPLTGRERLVELVVAVKYIFGVFDAKMLFTPPGTFIKLADVPEDRVEGIIKAAEEKLKKVIE